MKKTINLYVLLALIIACLTLTSCREDDKDRFNDFQAGAFVTFENKPEKIVGVNSIEDLRYKVTLIAPSNNVKQYDLEVSAVLSGKQADTVSIGKFTSFPIELNYTAQDLATALGKKVSDINFGDSFAFMGRATRTDGAVYYNEEPSFEIEKKGDKEIAKILGGNTEPNLYDKTNGYNDAYSFGFTIGCPANSYNEDTVAGTYEITESSGPSFKAKASTVTVVKGPGKNQFTIKNFIDHDLICDVDPATGDITVKKQVVADDIAPYGKGSVGGKGTAFACVGTYEMSLETTVSAGSFGSSLFKIKKK